MSRDEYHKEWVSDAEPELRRYICELKEQHKTELAAKDEEIRELNSRLRRTLAELRELRKPAPIVSPVPQINRLRGAR